jgi:CheY-like chemotaxis protein
MSEGTAAPFRILHIENDPAVTRLTADVLRSANYEVLIANSGRAGVKQAKKEKPDLIILDVMMPDMDGHEVLRRLRASEQTRHIPVLMLTVTSDKAYSHGTTVNALAYVAKPYDRMELKEVISSLLVSSLKLPYENMQDDCIVTISCLPDQKPYIRVSGLYPSGRYVSETNLAINVDEYEEKASVVYMAGRKWRFMSKTTGRELHKTLFRDHIAIQDHYSRVYGAVSQRENSSMHIRFESSPNFIRVPLEFLFESSDNMEGQYAVLIHAMARSMTNVGTNKPPLSPMFLNELYKEKAPLRILLIASNTVPAIDAVDAEVMILSKKLPKLFEKKGIKVADPTVVPTEKATATYVRELLEECEYHIVHYAGHSGYIRNSPEESYLNFHKRENDKGGETERIEASELRLLLQGSLLQGSQTRLFYLNCCSGTATADTTTLMFDSVLGIADALVHAGVNAVLGYRWPANDKSAYQLALDFYTALADYGRIDTALLIARQKTARLRMDDITWISPILIIQD